VLLIWPLAADAIQIRHDDGKGQEVALTGFISNLLGSFEAALGCYAEYNRTRQDVLRYVGPFGSYYDDEHGKSISVMDVADEKKSPKDRCNTFVSLLQESAWTKILGHPGFQSILTERARNMMKNSVRARNGWTSIRPTSRRCSRR